MRFDCSTNVRSDRTAFLHSLIPDSSAPLQVFPCPEGRRELSSLSAIQMAPLPPGEGREREAQPGRGTEGEGKPGNSIGSAFLKANHFPTDTVCQIKCRFLHILCMWIGRDAEVLLRRIAKPRSRASHHARCLGKHPGASCRIRKTGVM